MKQVLHQMEAVEVAAQNGDKANESQGRAGRGQGRWCSYAAEAWAPRWQMRLWHTRGGCLTPSSGSEPREKEQGGGGGQNRGIGGGTPAHRPREWTGEGGERL